MVLFFGQKEASAPGPDFLFPGTGSPESHPSTRKAAKDRATRSLTPSKNLTPPAPPTPTHPTSISSLSSVERKTFSGKRVFLDPIAGAQRGRGGAQVRREAGEAGARCGSSATMTSLPLLKTISTKAEGRHRLGATWSSQQMRLAARKQTGMQPKASHGSTSRAKLQVAGSSGRERERWQAACKVAPLSTYLLPRYEGHRANAHCRVGPLSPHT